MGVHHLGYAKGRDREASRHCNEFINIARREIGRDFLKEEHGTLPSGVYLSRDNIDWPRIGLVIQYEPEVLGAREGVEFIKERANRWWNEAWEKTQQPNIMKRIKVGTEELKR